ncbi:LysE family transporter [Prauserella flavalba]|uniref:LysE family transporter n=1 Tax=Prauserella flavalba TaxID=1477506 RepID=UPI0036EFD2CE
MTAALVAGLVAGYGIAIPVGAVGAYLVALTARTSLRVGVSAALGIATADGAYALAAVLGGSALATLIEPITVPLRWASAIVLVAIAAAVAVSAIRRHREQAEPAEVRATSAARAYASLLGITVLNPATIVYFAALVLGDVTTIAATPATATAFVAAAFAASASWQLLLACGGAVLGRAVTSPRGRLGTALLSSAVVTALALDLVLA